MARARSYPKRKQPKRERDGWLTFAIVMVIIHGLLMLGIAFGESGLRNTALPTWFVVSVIGVAIADIVAGIALWNWKGWGFYLYLGATIVAIALGLIATGSALFAFSRIIPFVIVGYIMRPKWPMFE